MMKKNRFRLFALLLCLALAVGIPAGCSGDEPAGSAPPAEESVQQTEAPAAAAPDESEAPAEASGRESKVYAFPVENGPTFTSICSISPNLANSGKLSDGNDMGWVQWLSERTGVKIENRVIAFTMASEQYNLMFASGETTDIMLAATYSGGNDQAVEDEVFVNIAPYMDYMPDYANKLHSDLSYLSGAYTAEKNLVAFYGFNDEETLPDFGPHIRGDYLDAVGMELPETYDELYEVLKAFKEQLGVDSPLWINGNGGAPGDFSGGYNVPEYAGMGAAPFYTDRVDGEYKFGPVQDAFRDYLTMMNKWYSEGLIYPDFLNNVYDYPEDSTIAEGEIGVWCSYVAYLKTENDLLQDLDPSYNVRGFSYPVLNRGDPNYFGKGALSSGVEGQGAFYVTTSCEDVPLLCSVMNEFYTEEGQLFGNYGIEGETFEYDENGEPYLNDYVNHNPDGLSTAIVMSLHFFKDGPVVKDFAREFNGYTDYQKEAVELWATEKDSMAEFSVLSTEESTELYTIQSDLATYYSENLIKFIMGERSLDTWEEYVQGYYDLGLERALELGVKGIEAGSGRKGELQTIVDEYVPYEVA